MEEIVIFVCFLLLVVAIIISIIKAMRRAAQKSNKNTVVVVGWLLTIIGIIGTIVSYNIYLNAKDDYENRFYSYVSSARSDMENAQITMYVCIALAVLGIILLIIGYISKASKESLDRQEKMMLALVNNHEVAVGDTHTATDGSWVCNCGKRNTPASNYCGKCGKKKPVTPQQSTNNSSAASRIKELKELLDNGLITREEFDAKRKDLLDKM